MLPPTTLWKGNDEGNGAGINIDVPEGARGLYFVAGFSEQFEDIFYDDVRVCSAYELEIILHHLFELQVALDIGFCIRR